MLLQVLPPPLTPRTTSWHPNYPHSVRFSLVTLPWHKCHPEGTETHLPSLHMGFYFGYPFVSSCIRLISCHVLSLWQALMRYLLSPPTEQNRIGRGQTFGVCECIEPVSTLTLLIWEGSSLAQPRPHLLSAATPSQWLCLAVREQSWLSSLGSPTPALPQRWWLAWGQQAIVKLQHWKC